MLHLLQASELDGVTLKRIEGSTDTRGHFIKIVPSSFLSDTLDSVAYSINYKIGTIRGIHFQIEPFAEEKIIACVQGATFEVIVDLRPDSKSFGGVATFELSQENAMQLYLPKGIAHGFQTLKNNTILQYCLTAKYMPQSSYSIDPLANLGFNWPNSDFSISLKDSTGISFDLAAQKYRESLVPLKK